MRYILRFNENMEEKINQLKDLCEGSLAYLLDDTIELYYYPIKNYQRVSREMLKKIL